MRNIARLAATGGAGDQAGDEITGRHGEEPCAHDEADHRRHRQARHGGQADGRKAQFRHGVEQIDEEHEDDGSEALPRHGRARDQDQETRAAQDEADAELGRRGRFESPPVEDRPQQREQRREQDDDCLLYTSPSPRDRQKSRMPSSA